MMASKPFVKGEIFRKDEGKDIVFLEDTYDFRENIRMYANGLINANGGVIFVGIRKFGVIQGTYVSRRHEDEYRLLIDRVIGSFQPFYAPCNYRIVFHPVLRGRPDEKVIELKLSAADRQIYEDGQEKLFLFSKDELLGPLWPQEIKQLVINRYQEGLQSMKGLENFITPAVQRTSRHR